MLARTFAFALATLAAGSAFAGGLFAPISMDSAATMPKGVRSFRLTGFTTEIFDKYDGYGAQVPLANSFNKNVKWRELIDSRPTSFERGQLKGGLQAEGFDLDEAAGRSEGLVNTRLNSTIPVFAMGLTDTVTLGFGLPILRSSMNVSTGWTVSALGQERIDTLMRRGYEPKIRTVEGALQNVVETRIAQYGYRPLVNEEHTDIGDLTVAGKWKFFANDDMQFAIAPRLVLPTGRTADVNKVVDVAGGDGQVDTGVAVVGDYTLNGKWVFTGAAGYTYQWASNKAKRIPRTGEESISPDVDWNTREKFGDIWGSSAAAKYRVNNLVLASLGYSLQYKDADRYEGGAFQSEHYRYLEVDTWQFMQAAQLALSASTVPLYRAGVFPVPLDATLGFSRVFDGRNAGKIDLAVLELAAYF